MIESNNNTVNDDVTASIESNNDVVDGYVTTSIKSNNDTIDYDVTESIESNTETLDGEVKAFIETDADSGYLRQTTCVKNELLSAEVYFVYCIFFVTGYNFGLTYINSHSHRSHVENSYP